MTELVPGCLGVKYLAGVGLGKGLFLGACDFWVGNGRIVFGVGTVLLYGNYSVFRLKFIL
jgi:hypothetical protein